MYAVWSSVRSGWHWLSSKQKTETNWFYETHESCLCKSQLEKRRYQFGRKLNLLPTSMIAASPLPLRAACPCVSVCALLPVFIICHCTFPLQNILSPLGSAQSGKAAVSHVSVEGQSKEPGTTRKAEQCINHWCDQSAVVYKAASLKHSTYGSILIKHMFYAFKHFMVTHSPVLWT